MNKSYYNLYSQSTAIEEIILNEICILRKEVYTKKDGMEHLISFDIKFDDENKKNKLHVRFSLLQEEKLKLRNQIIENHITIEKMQNVLNAGKDSQADSEEIDMAKLLNNGEILTLDK